MGQSCGATAFTSWCQASVLELVPKASNAAIKEKYLADVLSASISGDGYV